MIEKIVYGLVLTLFAGGIYFLGFFSKSEIRLGRRVFLGMKHSDRKTFKEFVQVGFIKKIKRGIDNSRVVKKYNENRINREIYEGLALLRNMTATSCGKALSCDFALSRLSERRGILQETYKDMLALIRRNKLVEAQNILNERCHSKAGEEYAALLLGLDASDTGDLREIIISYQKSIREINATKAKKREELISDLIYFPAMINILAVFMNFVYVGYFVEQRQLLQMIF